VIARRHLPAIDRVLGDAQAQLATRRLSAHQQDAVTAVVAEWATIRAAGRARARFG